ncbi:D-beta-hydroxybutyrate dehydrogenase, mitochondrial-like isoform X2 [Ruditapes philippinarum]|uniref:D-beta-hydroxybutyrate dehydrogenase, mitochondrial-like isoform X2 n=1 Tax=Ruditapes philippinarum TaxID=129788 RepID=UPI00295BF57C|nr:D-beta-hydroxybutyrate dehydrogenase, mitochondrial-like isoform X2 [Ruditapes philippinarum]
MEIYISNRLFYLAWGLVTLFFVYKLILEVYTYILSILIAYILLKLYAKKFKNKIKIKGQAVLITGCDTGHDAALRLASIGFNVFAGCLTPDGVGVNTLREKGGETLHVVPLDVTSDTSVKDALEVVKRKSPDAGLWAVINNAGIAFNGDVEIASIETMKRIAEVNIYGMIRVTQACLPLIRKSKGRIINVTSVKGRLAIPTDAPYTMTKWAGEALSDSLRREMYRFGVNVIIIEPGHFGGITGMLTNESGKLATENLEEAWHNASSNVKSVYGRQYIDGLINNIRHVGEGGATNTEPVSDAMQDAVENVSPKYRYLVHGTNSSFDKYCVLAVLNQVLPEVVMDWLVRYTFPLPRTTEQNN